jgi:hypothetical protein
VARFRGVLADVADGRAPIASNPDPSADRKNRGRDRFLAMESNANRINDEQLVEDGSERVKADLAALDPKDLVQVNLDATAAVTTTLGVVPEVKNLREKIAKELPSFDLAEEKLAFEVLNRLRPELLALAADR